MLAKEETSTAKSLTCTKEETVLLKNADYQKMIQTAARKAADIQMQATCTAEQKVMAAYNEALVAKSKLP